MSKAAHGSSDVVSFLVVDSPPESRAALIESWTRRLRAGAPSTAVYAPDGDIEGPVWFLADGPDLADQALSEAPSMSPTLLEGAPPVAVGTVTVRCEMARADHLPGEPAPYLMPLAYAVPSDAVADLDAFYVEEHLPIVLECEGWMRARLCDATGPVGAGWNRVVLHELRSAHVLHHGAIGRARSTDWMAALTAHRWFTDPPRQILARVSGPAVA